MSTADLATLKAPLVESENARLQSVADFCKFIRDNSIRTEQDLISNHGLRLLRNSPGSVGNDGTMIKFLPLIHNCPQIPLLTDLIQFYYLLLSSLCSG